MGHGPTLILTTRLGVRPLGVRGDPLHAVAGQLLAVIRRRLGDGPANLLAEPQLRACRAVWKGADAGLTLTEYKIVHLLVTNLGSPLTYREVHDTMHHAGFVAGSGEDGYRANVRACIKRIRSKFRALDPGFACIANYPSFGYRWMVDPLPPSG